MEEFNFMMDVVASRVALGASVAVVKNWYQAHTGKDSGESYLNGVAKYSEDWDDDSWSLTTGDLNFKTYFGIWNDDGFIKIKNKRLPLQHLILMKYVKFQVEQLCYQVIRLIM